MVLKPFLPTDSFRKALTLSFIGHCGLILFFTLKALILPQKPLVIRETIRVDLIGLPDKIIKKSEHEISPPTQSNSLNHSHPQQEIKPPTPLTMTSPGEIKQAKKNQTKAIAKLNALDTIAQWSKEMDYQKAKEKVQQQKINYKGNVLSAGDSLTGLNALDYESYFTTLKEKIQKNFIIPQWLAEAQLRAQVLVKIDERGYVISRQLVESSGQEVFDQKVLEAIDHSSPFSPPPERLVQIMSIQGLTFNFPN